MAKTSDRNGKNGNGNGRLFTTQQSLDSYVKSICDIMRRSNCAGALQYVPELTWILFLRILDELEADEQDELEAVGQDFTPSLGTPYRWREWAAPYDEDMVKQVDDLPQGWKRKELTDGAEGEFFKFLHDDLIPHLKGLKDLPSATPRQKVISEIMSDWNVPASTLRKTFKTSSTKFTPSVKKTSTPPTSSPSPKSMKGSCSKWAKKATTGGSSSPHGW